MKVRVTERLAVTLTPAQLQALRWLAEEDGRARVVRDKRGRRIGDAPSSRSLGPLLRQGLIVGQRDMLSGVTTAALTDLGANALHLATWREQRRERRAA